MEVGTQLATLEDSIKARAMVDAAKAVGIPDSHAPGFALMMRDRVVVDASSGSARVVARSGRSLDDEVRAMVADPAMRPVLGLPPAPRAIPGVEPGSFADVAVRQEQARMAEGSNPYGARLRTGPAPFIGHSVSWDR